jgi:hypothetical protein
MMKFEFTKDQIERLLETYNVKDIDKLLNEDIATSIIAKFLGKRIAAKLEANYGDDAVKVLDNLFAAAESRAGNIIKGADKKLYLVSGSGKQWSMDVIKKTIDGVASGKLPVSDLKYLPNTLKDGQEFRKIFQNQFKYGKPKLKTNPNITPTGELTYPQSFAKGYKAIQAPMLFTKGFLRKQPLFKKYFRSKYTKLTDDEVNKVWLWFFTGVGDAGTVRQIFQKSGLPKALVNVGGQLFAKWVFWSIVISLSNLAIDLAATVGTKIYPNQWEAFKGRWNKNAELASLHWIIPIGVIMNNVVGPLMQGGIAEFLTKNFIDRWESAKKQALEEKARIEAMSKDVVKNKSSLKNIIPQSNNKKQSQDSTTQNFKASADSSQSTNTEPLNNKIKIDY